MSKQLSVAVQSIDALEPVEAYDFADSRFLFVQPDLALFFTQVFGHKSMPSHVHEDAHQFSFITQGKGQVTVGDSTIEISQGTCIRIPAGVSHSWHNPHDEPLQYMEAKIPVGKGADMIKYTKRYFPDMDDKRLAIGI